MTGAVEVMLVDMQCVFPALTELQKCFHTKVVSHQRQGRSSPTPCTSSSTKTTRWRRPRRSSAWPSRTIPHRDPAKVNIPKAEERLVAGFTTEVIFNILGGRYRPSFRPLNDGIQTGRLRGVAGVVGCNNPKFPHDECHLAMVKELIRNDVLVVQTGCSAIACAKAGLLTPEAAEKYRRQGAAGDLPRGGHPAGAARRQLRGQHADPHRLRGNGRAKAASATRSTSCPWSAPRPSG